MDTLPLAEAPPPAHRWWPAAAVWLAAWGLMFVLDRQLDLASLAMILVLAAALAALWLPPWPALAACCLSVVAFNLSFVPPRGSFTVELQPHALLLATLLAVSGIVALLMSRQRQLAARERLHSLRAAQLQSLGETLRDAADPRERAPALQGALGTLTGQPAVLLLPSADNPARQATLGTPTPEEAAGLQLTLRRNHAMGPGTGQHTELAAWYLPLRGRSAAFGAAVLRLDTLPEEADTVREHAQALCDQLGLALERDAALRSAADARDAAQAHSLRNTMLAAIAHDHRTPLATILGAASSLHDQADRLAPEQRKRLAATIVDEATQLARLTDNTLQLARLDTPGLALNLDWESAEELVGTALVRLRRRHPAARVKARVEPGLPLLRCDAVLLVQLLDNLVDNALKYGGDTEPVEIVVRAIGGRVVLAVRDRGPGVPPEHRPGIFEAFQRGPAVTARGAGVGLAVCRAIARVHGGELTLRPRAHGGSSFECALPSPPPPAPGAP